MSRVWLIGAAVFVAALAVAGIVVALLTTDGELLPEDSPEGVLQRYLRALEDGEHEEAYAYLAGDTQATCPFLDFVKQASYQGVRGSQMTLEDVDRFDDRALVTANVTVFDPNIPFGPEEHSYERTFELTLERGGWKMTWPEDWCGPLY
ncbi:MAG: hypothetical protein WEE64_00145 [Dehalococcoidia bacterium]